MPHQRRVHQRRAPRPRDSPTLPTHRVRRPRRRRPRRVAAARPGRQPRPARGLPPRPGPLPRHAHIGPAARDAPPGLGHGPAGRCAHLDADGHAAHGRGQQVGCGRAEELQRRGSGAGCDGTAAPKARDGIHYIARYYCPQEDVISGGHHFGSHVCDRVT